MCGIAPYLVTDSRHERWAADTRAELLRFDERAGVRRVRGREVARAAMPAPAWMRGLPAFRPCAGTELPEPYAAGWWYETPVVDMPVYLDALRAEAADRGTDPATAIAIRERCAAIEPSVRKAAVVEHRVGLRPARHRVRLERAGRVVHNYGHGGAGVTLSWGCAAEVLRLVRESLAVY